MQVHALMLSGAYINAVNIPAELCFDQCMVVMPFIAYIYLFRYTNVHVHASFALVLIVTFDE